MRGAKGYTSHVYMPPPVEALKLSPVDRLERLQRELRAATIWLQRLARDQGKRCDSPAQAEALADLIARGGIEPVLTHAVQQYQNALARLRSEMGTREISAPGTRTRAITGSRSTSPKRSKGRS